MKRFVLLLVIGILCAAQASSQPDIDTMPLKQLRQLAKDQQKRIVDLESKLREPNGPALPVKHSQIFAGKQIVEVQLIGVSDVGEVTEGGESVHVWRVVAKIKNVAAYPIREIVLTPVLADNQLDDQYKSESTRPNNGELKPGDYDFWVFRVTARQRLAIESQISCELSHVATPY